MRIVVVPTITTPNLESESEFLLWMRFLKILVARHEDLFFYMIVPDLPFKYDETMPRIKWIREPWINVYYDKVGDPSATFMNMFSPRIGKYLCDAVITARTAAAVPMARNLWDYRCKEMIPVFVKEEKVVEPGKAHQTVKEIEVIARSLGYVFGYTLFDSEMERSIAMRVATQYLRPNVAERVFKRSAAIPPGIDCTHIDEVTKDIKKTEKFSVFFGGRLNEGSKRAEDALSIMEKFFSFGRDIEVVVSTSSTPKDYVTSCMEFHGRQSQMDFWRHASKTHAWVSCSRVEGFTIGVTEQLYMGGVGILPRLFWVEGILKEKFKDYPFLYDNFTEAATILRWVHENQEEAKKRIAWVRPFIRERYDVWNCAEEQYTWMKKVMAGMRQNYLWSPGNVELMTQTLNQLGDRFSMSEFWDAMVDNSRSLKKGKYEPKLGQLTKYAVYQWLKARGLRDECTIDEPVFVKVARSDEEDRAIQDALLAQTSVSADDEESGDGDERSAVFVDIPDQL